MTTTPTTACAGFGLGLRTPHYADFLARRQPLDWLEIITDNFLVEGGKPLVMLDTIRRDYPMAMHGVAMSIGVARGLDLPYVNRVKALADRIEPLWVSDHLCWIGPGPEQLHDLYPLPYTDEAARHVIAQVRQAQDILQRRLVLENVSSYIDFQSSACSEWQFLSYIAQEADCLLLVDINNIFVSSVNHRFDPREYVNALPRERVQQIHLAGHADHGNYIVDTHDHPVAQSVWDLYAHACQRFGAVATMIERDDDIPALQTLLDELALAREIAVHSVKHDATPYTARTAVDRHGIEGDTPGSQAQPTDSATLLPLNLALLQQRIGDFILDRQTTAAEPAAPADALVRVQAGVDAPQRLGIYHHAYRARLVEVLADSFAKTHLFMGSETFEEDAALFAVSHPPMTRSLGRYGAELPAFLGSRYPSNPELQELAQLDWDLRTRFDGPNVAALNAESAQQTTADHAPDWLSQPAPLHPSLLLRPITTNVVQIWQAIDKDAEVPEVQPSQASALAVWRHGLQPHFQSLQAAEADFLQRLQDGGSIDQTATQMVESNHLTDPQQLGQWLQSWLALGLLRQPADTGQRVATSSPQGLHHPGEVAHVNV